MSADSSFHADLVQIHEDVNKAIWNGVSLFRYRLVHNHQIQNTNALVLLNVPKNKLIFKLSFQDLDLQIQPLVYKI